MQGVELGAMAVSLNPFTLFRLPRSFYCILGRFQLQEKDLTLMAVASNLLLPLLDSVSRFKRLFLRVGCIEWPTTRSVSPFPEDLMHQMVNGPSKFVGGRLLFLVEGMTKTPFKPPGTAQLHIGHVTNGFSKAIWKAVVVQPVCDFYSLSSKISETSCRC